MPYFWKEKKEKIRDVNTYLNRNTKLNGKWRGKKNGKCNIFRKF